MRTQNLHYSKKRREVGYPSTFLRRRLEPSHEACLHLERDSGRRLLLGRGRYSDCARDEAGGGRARDREAIWCVDGGWAGAVELQFLPGGHGNGGGVLQPAVRIVVGRCEPGGSGGGIADVYRECFCG